MTGIETKALVLLNEVARDKGVIQKFHVDRRLFVADEALCRAIEAHEADKVAHASQIHVMHSRIAQAEEQLEAFKQKVSDAVESYFQPPNYLGKFNDTLGRFIIPKPKPDPLVEALVQVDFVPWKELSEHADDFRAALDAVGLEIREKGQ